MEKVRLETQDLVLKKSEYDDWEALFKNIWSKSESAKYMLWTVIKTEDEAKERMRKGIKYQEQEKYALIVYLKETMEAIGWATMHEIEPGIYEEDGIAIGPAFVGKGFGKQILKALCDEASRCGAKEFRGGHRMKTLRQPRCLNHVDLSMIMIRKKRQIREQAKSMLFEILKKNFVLHDAYIKFQYI